MNNIELNAILYYADYLSLRSEHHPVSNNCKYYFIKHVPINSSCILGYELEHDENNKYYIQSKLEYEIIKDRLGEDAARSFVDSICYLNARGTVDAELILEYVHRYSDKNTRRHAFLSYYNWKNSQKFTHQIINDNGDIEERECSRYVYNAERDLKRSNVQKGTRIYDKSTEETIEINK